MNERTERIARIVAMELMELTPYQRNGFKFPDDANGDTCERARSTAHKIEAVLAESGTKRE